MGEGKCPSGKVWGDLLFCVGFFSTVCNDFLMPLNHSLSRKQKINKNQGG